MGGRRSQGAGLVVAEAVGVPADVQDHGAVQEPVEQGGASIGVSDVCAAQSACWCVAYVVHTGDAGALIVGPNSADRCRRGWVRHG